MTSFTVHDAVEYYKAHPLKLHKSVNSQLIFVSAFPKNDGEYLKVYKSEITACAYGLRHTISARENRLAVIYSIQDEYGVGNHVLDDREMSEAIIDYFVNQSPMAICYYDKKPGQILDQGYFTFRTDVPNKLLGIAVMQTRMLWEQHSHGKALGVLLENGCDPDMAYLASYIYRWDGLNGGFKLSELSHGALYPTDISKNFVTSFVKRNVDNSHSLYHDDSNFSGSRSAFLVKGKDGPGLRALIEDAYLLRVKKNNTPTATEEYNSPFKLSTPRNPMRDRTFIPKDSIGDLIEVLKSIKEEVLK